jgi:hypothetical protein
MASDKEAKEKEAAEKAKKRNEDYLKRVKEQFEKEQQLREDTAAQGIAMMEEDEAARLDMELRTASEIAIIRDDELSNLTKLFQQGAMETEDYEAERLRITRKYEKQIMQVQLEAVKRLIDDSTLTEGKKAELQAKSAAIQLQIDNQLTEEKLENQKRIAADEKETNDKLVKANEDKNKKKIEDDKKAAIQKKEIEDATVDLVKEAGAAIFEINNNRMEDELYMIERKRDTEIKAAGDNKEAQLAINEKYDKEAGKLKVQQAKNDRNAALFQIAINTATGITKALNVLPPAGYVLAGITAALGAIQAGVVLSKKIPEYKLGTQSSQGGPALVGEEGTELMVTPKREIRFTPNKPTVVFLEANTKIFTAKETKQLIEKGMQNAELYGAVASSPERTALSQATELPRINAMTESDLITRKGILRISETPIINIDLDPVIQAIKNKREYYFNFRDDGIDITEKDGDFYRNYKNNFKL